MKIRIKTIRQRTKGDKKVHLSLEDYVSFSETSSIGQLLCQCSMWETGFDGHSETDCADICFCCFAFSKVFTTISSWSLHRFRSYRRSYLLY